MPSVLLVEDSAAVRKVIKRMLEGNGCAVHEAEDGYCALARLEHLQPDVVLTDLALPKIDGVRLAQIMASHPALADIPVILMSGDTSATIGSAYPVLEKPFSMQQLITCIHQTVGR